MMIVVGGLAMMAGAIVFLGAGWGAGIKVSQMSPATAVLLAGLAIAAPGTMIEAGRRLGKPGLMLTGFVAYPFCFGVVCPATFGLLAQAGQTLGLSGRPFLLAALVLTVLLWGMQALILRMAVREGEVAPSLPAAVGRQALLLLDEHVSWIGSLLAISMAALFYRDLLPAIPWPLWSAAVIGASLAAGLLGALLVTTLLRRWSTVVPDDTRRLIDRVADLTGVRFSGIAYFDERFARRPIMEVRMGWMGHLLFLNRTAIEPLTPDELLAILAHEAAHVRLRHLLKEVVCAACLSWVVMQGLRPVMGLLFASSTIVALNVLIALSVALTVCRNALRRRWEREADDYAASIAGAPAVASALMKLPAIDVLWGTHDNRDVRVRRLEQAGV